MKISLGPDFLSSNQFRETAAEAVHRIATSKNNGKQPNVALYGTKAYTGLELHAEDIEVQPCDIRTSLLRGFSGSIDIYSKLFGNMGTYLKLKSSNSIPMRPDSSKYTHIAWQFPECVLDYPINCIKISEDALDIFQEGYDLADRKNVERYGLCAQGLPYDEVVKSLDLLLAYARLETDKDSLFKNYGITRIKMLAILEETFHRLKVM